jgi:hypothetical protein
LRALPWHHANVPRKADGHGVKREDEAIQLDCHGAIRAPRNDKRLEIKGLWYYRGIEP